MSTTAEKHPDVTHLLEIVELLSPSEVDTVVNRVRAVKAKRKAALALTSEEKRRIAAILQEVPDESRARYAALVQQHREAVLEDEAQEELVCLSDWIELVEVKRLEYLAELAAKRGVPLLTLMDTLGIKSPSSA